MFLATSMVNAVSSTFFGEEAPSRGKFLPMLTDAYGIKEGTLLEIEITQNPGKFLNDGRPLVAKIAQEITTAIDKSKSFIGNTEKAFAGIYDKLDGVHWKVDTPGWSIYERHEPISTWYGIATDPENPDVVTGIKLVGNRMNGEFRDLLSVLAEQEAVGSCKLTEINVASNSLKGLILPKDIAKLPNVVVFCANFNELRGELYSDILGKYWKNLTVLALQHNLLTGSLPSFSAKRCPNIRILHLYDNQFDGELPESFSELTFLEEVRLWKNKLTGKIPASYGKLKRLRVLHLGGNALSGEIPKELEECHSLEGLYLHDNKLQGEVPFGLMEIPNIKTIALRDNNLKQLPQFEAKCLEKYASTSFTSSDIGMSSPHELFEWNRASAEAKEAMKDCDE